MNWDDYENFTKGEFSCTSTDECKMEKDFMDRLQKLRTHLGFPFKITSGYRHHTHPIERAKSKPGEHTLGKACDIACRGEEAYNIIKSAPLFGFTRIGVSQSGNSRFLHLGTATKEEGFLSPWLWSY